MDTKEELQGRLSYCLIFDYYEQNTFTYNMYRACIEYFLIGCTLYYETIVFRKVDV